MSVVPGAKGYELSEFVETPDAPDAEDAFTQPFAPAKPIFDISETEKQKLVRDIEHGIQAAVKSIADYGLPSTEGEWHVLRFRAVGIYLGAVGEIEQDSVDLLKKAAGVHLEFLKCNDQDDEIAGLIAAGTPGVDMDTTSLSMAGGIKCTTGSPVLKARESWKNIIRDYYGGVVSDVFGALKWLLGVQGVYEALRIIGVERLPSISRYFTDNLTLRSQLDALLNAMSYNLEGLNKIGMAAEMFFDPKYWGANEREICKLLVRRQSANGFGIQDNTWSKAFKAARTIYQQVPDGIAQLISPNAADVTDNWVRGDGPLRDYALTRWIGDFFESITGYSWDSSMAIGGVSLLLLSIAHMYLSYRPKRLKEFLGVNNNATNQRWKLELDTMINNINQNYKMVAADQATVNNYRTTLDQSSQSWSNAVAAGTQLTDAQKVGQVNDAILVMTEADETLTNMIKDLVKLPHPRGGGGGGRAGGRRPNRSPARTRQPLMVYAVVDAFLAKRLAAQQLK